MYEAKAAQKNCVRFATELPERAVKNDEPLRLSPPFKIEDDSVIS
jgi:hypothetical protein